MSQQMQSRTARFFDRYSQDFEAIYGNDNRLFDQAVNRLFRQAMVMRYEETLRSCSPIEGCSVLDVGCGPGHYSVALAQRGASRVVGVDFAENMVSLAAARAQRQGVADRCEFSVADFLTHPFDTTFDYVVVMGFMDYMREPERVIERVAQLCTRKAVFSFPADGGILAWQRKLRYRRRCDLFMYRHEQIHQLMSRIGAPFSIKRLSRDFFVTLEPKARS